MSLGKVVLALALFAAAAILGHRGWLEWQRIEPGFHAQDCWFAKTIVGEARCGFMVVRENRQNPDSRTIRLPVVIFAAQPHVDRKEPILFLTGGPGSPAYLGEQAYIEGWWETRRLFPQGHDLIVMGQRGTGLNEADFECDEFASPDLAFWDWSEETAESEFRSRAIQATVDCAARLAGEGVDLSAYNSRETAADIAALRQALEIDEWTLYGVSYGSRFALSTLRYHPEGIRAVILDSVFPPEANQTLDMATYFEQALQRFFADCAARPACAGRYGDLATAYAEAGTWLQNTLPDVTLGEIFGPEDQVFRIGGIEYRYTPSKHSELREQPIHFDKRLLDLLLFNALYFKESRQAIPRLLRQTALQDSVALRQQFRAYMMYSAAFDLNTAIYLSHVCHDDAPFEGPEAIAAAIETAGPLGHLIENTFASYVCSHWPSGAAEAVENTPVRSPVPALLLSGHLDPVTPPAGAQTAASHLPNGHAYELANAGHATLYESDCAQRLAASFLRTLERPPENTCKAWELISAPEG